MTILKQNTAAFVYVPYTGLLDSVRIGKNASASVALAGSAGADINLGQTAVVSLAAGDTDTIGPLAVLVLNAGGVVAGVLQATVLVDYPGAAGPSAADIWAYATRRVSDATNITSNAATINQALVANLDAAVSTRLATAGYTAPPTANQNADALLDRADAIETGLTPRQAMRLETAALAGEVAISGATVTIRNTADTKARIIATTTTSGERTALTYDVS